MGSAVQQSAPIGSAVQGGVQISWWASLRSNADRCAQGLLNPVWTAHQLLAPVTLRLEAIHQHYCAGGWSGRFSLVGARPLLSHPLAADRLRTQRMSSLATGKTALDRTSIVADGRGKLHASMRAARQSCAGPGGPACDRSLQDRHSLGGQLFTAPSLRVPSHRRADLISCLQGSHSVSPALSLGRSGQRNPGLSIARLPELNRKQVGVHWASSNYRNRGDSIFTPEMARP